MKQRGSYTLDIISQHAFFNVGKIQQQIKFHVVFRLQNLPNKPSKEEPIANCRLDIQCFDIHNSINTFRLCAHPKDSEVSSQWDQIFKTFMVTMAMAAILKKSTLNAQLHTLSIIQVNFHYNRIKKYFNFHGYHGNGDHFENVKP